MKLLGVIVCLQVSISLVAIWSDARLERDLTEWSLYKLEHGKSYDNQQVDALRMELYYQNKEYVETYNRERSQETGITLGLNHMSDWTMEEKHRLNGLRVPEKMPQNSARAQKYLDDLLNDDSVVVPDEFDWRKVPGRVSPVKNQGKCGSCWAFSVTGALEGQELAQNKTKTLIPLSEQNLVDCDPHNHGCEGGWMELAFKFISANGGIEGEKTYPYVGVESKCHFKKENVVMTDSDVVVLEPNQEEKMKEIVAKSGPLSVGIDSTIVDVFHYKGGIVMGGKDCHHAINHAVLIVGYGTDNKTNTDYWIVKNSYGPKWGEDGYLRIVRGKNACFISEWVSVPLFD